VLKLTLEYDGAPFVGWQVQANGPSVQSAVQDAVAKLCGAPARVTGAGRTDAGVHARGQVASLEPPRELPLSAWTAGLNTHLPAEIACVRAEQAPLGFDARRWARGKRYVYTVLRSPVRSPLWSARAWQVRRPLDVAAMREALPLFSGPLDFAALRAADCPARTTVREVRQLSLRVQPLPNGELIELRIEATAFLKHMVRNLVGTLIEVGHGKRMPQSIRELLESQDRKRAGPTAPPHGLVLDEVFYLPGNAEPHAAEDDDGDE
jgi:tRNA pseudouridine38-40 synthase